MNEGKSFICFEIVGTNITLLVHWLQRLRCCRKMFICYGMSGFPLILFHRDVCNDMIKTERHRMTQNSQGAGCEDARVSFMIVLSDR